jgi:hypothetical protein
MLCLLRYKKTEIVRHPCAYIEWFLDPETTNSLETGRKDVNPLPPQ